MNYYNQRYDYSQNTLSAEDEVNLFCKKYQAQAELSRHKVYARPVPVRYTDWLKDGANIPFHQEIEREPMVEIYIPQDKFRDLVERDRWLGKMEQEAQYYKQKYLQEIEDDKIRHRNPAVKKVWEQYQMLLELAR
jgi:hypothetical protein